jgi:hypothetical protein
MFRNPDHKENVMSQKSTKSKKSAKTEQPEKKEYDILVTWMMAKHVKVKATSVEEGCELAHDKGTARGGTYVDGSFEVDRELAHGEYPDD